MKKLALLAVAAGLTGLVAFQAGAQTAATTTTTEIESPDGTTTTVISPGAAAPTAVAPVTGGTATGGTTVVVDPPVAIDAITGKPVSNTTAPEPKKEKESLRDKVRSKME